MYLKTQRLVIRNFKISDAQDYLLNIGSNENVAKYMLYPIINNISESLSIVEYFIEQDMFKNYHNYVIEYDNHLIGTIGINENDVHNFVELSYNLNEKYWHKGLMSEVLDIFIKYLFNEKNIECIYVEVMENNINSINLLKKYNFKLDGTVRKKYKNRYDKRVDVNIYTLLKNEI